MNTIIYALLFIGCVFVTVIGCGRVNNASEYHDIIREIDEITEPSRTPSDAEVSRNVEIFLNGEGTLVIDERQKRVNHLFNRLEEIGKTTKIEVELPEIFVDQQEFMIRSLINGINHLRIEWFLSTDESKFRLSCRTLKGHEWELISAILDIFGDVKISR